MTQDQKLYDVKLEVSLTLTVRVTATDLHGATHSAKWAWREQMSTAKSAGFAIIHDTIYVAVPQEVRS